VEPAYYRHLEQRRSEGRGERRGGERGRDRGHPRDRDRGRREPRPSGVPFPPPDIEDELSFSPGEDLLAPQADAVEAATVPEPEAPADSGVEAPAPEPSPKGRRSRGGSRRRRPAAEATPPAEEGASGDEQPRLMDSAERRTEDSGDSSEEGAGEAPSTPLIDEDEDLFFPRDQEVENGGAPRAHRRPEPVPDVEDQPYRTEESPGAESHKEEPTGSEEPHVQDMAEERIDEFDMEEFDESELPPRRRDGGRSGDRRGGRRGDRRGGRRPFGRPGSGRPKPLIQDIFKRGQEVIVQVIKEGIGTKGPTLSTYISIAGRYLVLMPSLNRLGVSRKIQDDEQRRRLREIVTELKPPKGLGFIVRTAAMEKNKKELQNDLAYLTRLYQVVARRIKKLKAPAEVYQESDMITRTIRDTFTNDIDTIWVDEPNAYEHAREFLQIVMPRYANRIKLYEGLEPLFHKYGIEDEIARIQLRHVPLPQGGSIVIEQTEALVAIDVNSGNFRAENNAEETAYQMNLHAAKEIARQLRLRDLGGVIVNDFIDMRDEKHRRGVEKALKDAIKRDRARTKVLRTSAFGLIEMTRQRIRPSLKRSVYQDCAHCLGTGQVKTCESMSIEVMRMLQLAAHRENVARISIRVSDDVAHYLQNKKRREIARLEEGGSIHVQIQGALAVPPETLEFVCYDSNNNEVRFLSYDDERPRRR
jgi:ribonuclease E